MATPADKKGMTRAKFGKGGKPVVVSSKNQAAAKAGKGVLFEDGSMKRPPSTKAGQVQPSVMFTKGQELRVARADRKAKIARNKTRKGGK